MRFLSWFGVGVVLLGLAACGGWMTPGAPKRPGASAVPAPSAPAAPAALPPTAALPPAGRSTPSKDMTSSFVLGINEAVAIPARLLDQGTVTASQVEPMLTADAAAARQLGATMVRGHTANYPRISMLTLERNPRALDDADRWVRAVHGAGLEGLLMVSPWPGNQTFNHTDTYVPPDLPAYEAYVRRIVERYDHDGVDDMPGLTAPIRYWEVDNEPDLKFNTPPKGVTKTYRAGTFCTPQEYAKVLIASSRAIKAAYPEAKVLNAGPFRPHAETGRAYLLDLFRIPGVMEAVDIVSIHTYPFDANGEVLARGVAAAQEVAPKKPLWVTETSVGIDEDTNAEEQGRQVVVIAARAAEGGAEGIFWHTLADPPTEQVGPARPQGPGGFRTNSLLQMQADGSKADKPAGIVYRNLAAVLKDHELIGATRGAALGQTRLQDGSVLVWSGSAPAPKGGLNLRTGLPIPPGQTATAPAWIASP